VRVQSNARLLMIARFQRNEKSPLLAQQASFVNHCGAE
jgi:hypothetical protein